MLPKGQKNISRLSLFFKPTRTKNIRNKFYSKAQCFKAIFSKVSFYNINFKGAILTNCSFKNASFSQVEFLGTNLKKSNFTGATFHNCIFSCVLLKKANFKNCEFHNCIFINTNLSNSKNLNIGNNCRVLSKFPSFEINKELLSLFNDLRFNPKLHNSRVLHLKGGKINYLTVMHLIDGLGEIKLINGLKLLKSQLPYRVITANSLYNIIDNASQKA